jgi:hypothetical protein
LTVFPFQIESIAELKWECCESSVTARTGKKTISDSTITQECTTLGGSGKGKEGFAGGGGIVGGLAAIFNPIPKEKRGSAQPLPHFLNNWP